MINVRYQPHLVSMAMQLCVDFEDDTPRESTAEALVPTAAAHGVCPESEVPTNETAAAAGPIEAVQTNGPGVAAKTSAVPAAPSLALFLRAEASRLSPAGVFRQLGDGTEDRRITPKRILIARLPTTYRPPPYAWAATMLACAVHGMKARRRAFHLRCERMRHRVALFVQRFSRGFFVRNKWRDLVDDARACAIARFRREVC